VHERLYDPGEQLHLRSRAHSLILPHVGQLAKLTFCLDAPRLDVSVARAIRREQRTHHLAVDRVCDAVAVQHDVREISLLFLPSLHTYMYWYIILCTTTH
jgi:hypothetical protein